MACQPFLTQKHIPNAVTGTKNEWPLILGLPGHFYHRNDCVSICKYLKFSGFLVFIFLLGFLEALCQMVLSFQAFLHRDEAIG